MRPVLCTWARKTLPKAPSAITSFTRRKNEPTVNSFPTILVAGGAPLGLNIRITFEYCYVKTNDGEEHQREKGSGHRTRFCVSHPVPGWMEWDVSANPLLELQSNGYNSILYLYMIVHVRLRGRNLPPEERCSSRLTSAPWGRNARTGGSSDRTLTPPRQTTPSPGSGTTPAPVG